MTPASDLSKPSGSAGNASNADTAASGSGTRADGNPARARRWERRLYTGAHPLAYPLLTGVGRLGPAVRVPGVGVVVNSPSLARDVLNDTDRFAKNGPGSSGALWTPVLGPSVLLNMEGDEHRALRGRLAGLFTPASARAICDRVLSSPGGVLERLAERLTRGETVDLVQPARAAAGAVIGELIGFPAVRGDDDRAYLDLFARGEEIVAMVGLRTRELSPAQVAKAKLVLADVVAPAAHAYREADPATVMGRMAASGLSETEALGAAAAFFLTGTETVATALPRLIAMLCDHGLDEEAGHSGGLPPWLDRATDEALRVMAPTPAMLRRAVTATRLGRVQVRPGDRVIIATLTCTRSYGPFDADAVLSGERRESGAVRRQPNEPDDPVRPGTRRTRSDKNAVHSEHEQPATRQGARPDDGPHCPVGERREPDVRRLWFGSGPHYCIGAPLALAEIRALAGTILAAAPLRVVRRRVSRGVLIPSYRLLEVTRR